MDCVAVSTKQPRESIVIIHEPSSSKEMTSDRTYQPLNTLSSHCEHNTSTLLGNQGNCSEHKEAEKVCEQHEANLQKLQYRINSRQKEEQKISWKVEDAGIKAVEIVWTSMDRVYIHAELERVKRDSIQEAKFGVQTTVQDAETVKVEEQLVLSRIRIVAEMVKIENQFFKKVLDVRE